MTKATRRRESLGYGTRKIRILLGREVWQRASGMGAQQEAKSSHLQQQAGTESKLEIFTLKPTSSDVLPPAKLHHLNFPKQPLIGDQMHRCSRP